MPRFVINVRELYDSDRRWIDSGFRVSPRPISRGNTGAPVIPFIDITAGQGLVEQFTGESEEMVQFEALGSNARV